MSELIHLVLWGLVAVLVVSIILAVVATRRRITQLDHEMREWGNKPLTAIYTGGIPVILAEESAAIPEAAVLPELGVLVAKYGDSGTSILPIENGQRPALCRSGALLVEEATERVVTKARRDLPAGATLMLRLDWVAAGVRIVAELPRGIEPAVYERWIGRERLVAA